MIRSGTGAWLVRTACMLGLASLLLTLPPALAMSGIVPFLPRQIENGLYDSTGTLCAGSCTCTYCDQLINGRCYTNGHLGHGTCSSTCGPRRCQFQPGTGGCGPILYLGCDSSSCTGSTPVIPRPTTILPPLPPGMGPTPTPVRSHTPVPTTVPGPICNRTWVETQPPSIDAILHEPPFPVLQPQEFVGGPDHGVDFHVTVRGGRAIQYAEREVRKCRTSGSYPRDCPHDWVRECETYVQANHPDPVAQVLLTLTLAPDSRHWIESYLESRYPRAHVQQSHHNPGTWQGQTMAETLVFEDWYPQDPGTYVGTVTIVTAGTPISEPQTVSRTHTVIVSLRDTTLAAP